MEQYKLDLIKYRIERSKETAENMKKFLKELESFIDKQLPQSTL